MIGTLAEGLGWLVVIALLCLYPAAWLVGRYAHRRKKMERSAMTVDHFAAELADEGFPSPAIRTAFHTFERREGIPVRKDDKLYETLGLVHEDLEELLAPHLKANGITDIEKTDLVALLPLITVRDYVAFLSALPSFKEPRS